MVIKCHKMNSDNNSLIKLKGLMLFDEWEVVVILCGCHPLVMEQKGDVKSTMYFCNFLIFLLGCAQTSFGSDDFVT